jgi:hypothetical protein
VPGCRAKEIKRSAKVPSPRDRTIGPVREEILVENVNPEKAKVPSGTKRQTL